MRHTVKKIIHILDGQPVVDGDRQRGQSTLELALVMPILLVLLASIIEMGWFANNYLILLEATRIGSRLGTQLSGDAGPIAWEMESVTLDDGTNIPTRDATLPVGSSADNLWSNRVRDCGNSSRTIGFYSAIACATYTALIPLDRTFDYDQWQDGDPAIDTDPSFDHTGELTNNGLITNDIVVSVFSLNRIPAADSDECSGGVCDSASSFPRPYEELQAICDADADDPQCIDRDDDGLYDGLPIDPDDGSRVLDGSQVVVTGRYPTNTNECADDSRDPFDFNGTPRLQALELDQTRVTMINDGRSFYDDTTDEGFRGFSLTGRWESSPGCIGSEWSIDRVESLVNLRQINANDPDILPEQQGLVLVEVFFEHQLLLELPLTGSFFSWTTAERDGVIQVWAAFPVGSTNFNISYTRECEDLLFTLTQSEVENLGVSSDCAAAAF